MNNWTMRIISDIGLVDLNKEVHTPCLSNSKRIRLGDGFSVSEKGFRTRQGTVSKVELKEKELYVGLTDYKVLEPEQWESQQGGGTIVPDLSV
jgi:hypothetical protein